jgi:hypothetical protein
MGEAENRQLDNLGISELLEGNLINTNLKDNWFQEEK